MTSYFPEVLKPHVFHSLVALIFALGMFNRVDAVQITSPNGGEVWTAGSQHAITWTPAYLPSSLVTISLSVDGEQYTAIASFISAAGQTQYTWSPICPVSSSARIRIANNSFPPNTDESDGFFTISGPTPAVTVTSPFGGEQWAEHSDHVITWVASGLPVNSYEIRRSLDNFNTYIVLASGLSPLLRSWTWYDVSPPSTSLKVQVVGHWDCGTVSDASDQMFEIVEEPSVSIGTPARMIIGQSAYIHWSSDANSSIYSFDLFLSRDDGATFPEQILDNQQNSDHTFQWSVTGPEVCSNDARIKVVASWLGGEVEDISGGFTIIASDLDLIAPVFDQQIPFGSTLDVQWQIDTPHPIIDQTLRVSRRNGYLWTEEFEVQMPSTIRSWSWNATQLNGHYLIAIVVNSVVCDFSGSSEVDIVDEAGRTIAISSPAEYQTWNEQECREVTWNCNGDGFESFDVGLRLGNMTWILATSLPGNLRNWLWESVHQPWAGESYVLEVTGHLVNGNALTDGNPIVIQNDTQAPSPLFVDAGAAPGGNGHINSPFRTVQEGIDAIPIGGTVIVQAGQYSLPATPVNKFVYMKTQNGTTTIQ